MPSCRVFLSLPAQYKTPTRPRWCVSHVSKCLSRLSQRFKRTTLTDIRTLTAPRQIRPSDSLPVLSHHPLFCRLTSRLPHALPLPLLPPAEKDPSLAGVAGVAG